MARTLELDTLKFPSSSTANLTLSDGGTLFGGTVDINAGNIDGTPIGANTGGHTTGKFTTLEATSTLLAAGAATLSSTLALTGNLAINTNKFTVDASTGNTLIAGTLTVNGGTTTIDTTNLAIKDTLVTLNSGASSGVDSGILVERGSTGNNAILFWDHNATKWTLGTTTAEPTTTGDLNVTTGTLVVATLEGDVTGALTGNATTATTLATARTIGMTGDVVWNSGSFNGSASVAASATIQPNSVDMPAMTTGNYVATVAAGGGITVSGSGSENAAVTVTHSNTSSQSSEDNSGNTWIQDIVLDEYGHVTSMTPYSLAGYNNSNWDTAYTEKLRWDGADTGLTAATGRTSLGLGTMATQASSSVSITGGTISGTTFTLVFSGDNNVHFGTDAFAGFDSSSSTNVAIGTGALKHTLTSACSSNVAIGTSSMNASGSFGSNQTISGSNNIALGTYSLTRVTSGYSNTALNYTSGNTITTGTYNICIGRGADVTAGGNNYAISIGKDVDAATDRISVGRSGQVITADFTTSGTWSGTSDVRKKTDIQNCGLGLNFIDALRTTTFKHRPAEEYPEEWGDFDDELDDDGNLVKRTYVEVDTVKKRYGMIAQEVKEAITDAGADDYFPGWSEDENGCQMLGYSDFVLPLIKAVQELSAKVTALEAA